MHRRAGWHWSRGSSEVRRPTRTGTLGITVRVSLHRYHAAGSRASAGWLQRRPVLLRFLPSRSARHGCSVSVVDCSGTSARSSTDRASDYGSEGWGFESLRARHRLSRSQRRPLSGKIVVLVIWPYFGLTRLVGSVIEPVGVAVHVTWVEVPVQVEGRGDAGVPHDLLEHLRRVPGLDHQRRGGMPQVVNAEPVAEPGTGAC